MRKGLVTIAAALALVVCATNSRAATIDLVIGDPYYVGTVVPGVGNPSDELAFIDHLITLDPEPNASSCGVSGNEPCFFTYGDDDYSRAGSTLSGPLPDPSDIVFTADKTDDGSYSTIDVTAATYIIGKYDQAKAGTLVWLVSDLESVNLPSEYNGHDISHYTLFAPVPDGGVTLMLLGGALLGLGALRRRFSA